MVTQTTAYNITTQRRFPHKQIHVIQFPLNPLSFPAFILSTFTRIPSSFTSFSFFSLSLISFPIRNTFCVVLQRCSSRFLTKHSLSFFSFFRCLLILPSFILTLLIVEKHTHYILSPHPSGTTHILSSHSLTTLTLPSLSWHTHSSHPSERIHAHTLMWDQIQQGSIQAHTQVSGGGKQGRLVNHLYT